MKINFTMGSWGLKTDKWLHMAAGLIVFILSGTLGLMAWKCLLIATVVGLLKELVDSTYQSGTVSDFIYTVVGALIGLMGVVAFEYFLAYILSFGFSA